jgi:hypothetical protein
MPVTVDISKYAENILSIEDRPLFEDAIGACKGGSLRAAYVMIWLACAESLKRRFREAQKRDAKAGIIVGEIKTKEMGHQAVDKFVLEKALEYGFISDSSHILLNHIYEMRCLYGHPYEESPSEEQVFHAAAIVVEHVLSKPVRLRHGYGEQLLKSLLEEPNFLDDQFTAVVAFVKDILPRIDESIHGWVLVRYWKELEIIADDSSLAIIFRRGIWFSSTMLIEAGQDVFSHDDWHNRFSKFPKILMRICSSAEIFKTIGERAQDTLVGSIISESSNRASVLVLLERLSINDALSQRQQERFSSHILDMDINTIRSSKLSTVSCYKNLVDAMRSHNWHIQNPAIDIILSNGPEQAARLSTEQQIILGRNILQCAEGTAKSAILFLEELYRSISDWPFDLVLGITLESFVNETNQIRFKDRHLSMLFSAIEKIIPKKRDTFTTKVAEAIEAGTPKVWVFKDDFEETIETLDSYKWASIIITTLRGKIESLPEKDDTPSPF